MQTVFQKVHSRHHSFIHTTARSTPIGPLLVKWFKACFSFVFSRVRASKTLFDTPGVTMAPWFESAWGPFLVRRLNCVILFSALAKEPSKRSFFSRKDLVSSSFFCNWSPRFWTPVNFDAIFFLSLHIDNNVLRRRKFSASTESIVSTSVISIQQRLVFSDRTLSTRPRNKFKLYTCQAINGHL